METPVDYGHYVRVRWHGPTERRAARFVASWQGWATDDHRPVRRTIPYTTDREAMARIIANAFVGWLNGADHGQELIPDRLALGSVGNDEWALLIHTRDRREA